MNKKTIFTTGEHLLEDVATEFTCWSCEGAGYFRAPSSEDEETKCLDCNGTGLNV